MKVFVYWNLHRDCWSVKALDGPNRGGVVHHATRVALHGCRFSVSESGRQRVLRDKRKNVHAGVVGTLIETTLLGKMPIEHSRTPSYVKSSDCALRVSYNPYAGPHFHERVTDKRVAVHGAGAVYMYSDRGVYALAPQGA